MPSPTREYALDAHLMERMKFCGMERENLADLVSIIVSLKNKYGVTPFATEANGSPVRDALTARYLVESTTLNKLTNIVHDTPRLNSVTLKPRGIPNTTLYEMSVTLGGQ